MPTQTQAASPTTTISSLVVRGLLWLLSAPFRLLWLVIVIIAPLSAVWIASSLAAHNGTSIARAAAWGLLLFPVIPLLWEALSSWRYRRKTPNKRRFLTLADRIILRTLLVSFAFVSVLLWKKPQSVFESLNSRGDWMLDGRTDPRSNAVRRVIFRTAARFGWLYRAAERSSFWRSRQTVRPRPRPIETNSTMVRRRPGTSQTSPIEPTPPTTAQPTRDPRQWPWLAELHPLIRTLPASVETSPEAVGQYIAANERDPWEKAKAVHDYVADRVAYDVPSYRAHQYPPQTAEHTFRTRLSVCAGYAALFYAIGRAAGLNVITIVGKARGMQSEGMGEGHAWNAVRLDNHWYLIDSTWDAGYVNDEGFVKRYTTSYFLMPPAAFFTRHWPEDNNWQLMTPVRTEGEFLRSPALWPEFFEYHLALRSPTRAETDAHERISIELENPESVYFMASVKNRNGLDSGRCECERLALSHVNCTFSEPGLHDITMFAARTEFSTYHAIGSLRVHNR